MPVFQEFSEAWGRIVRLNGTAGLSDGSAGPALDSITLIDSLPNTFNCGLPAVGLPTGTHLTNDRVDNRSPPA